MPGDGVSVSFRRAREGTPLEFDLRGRRTLMYRNATGLEEKLLRALQTMLCRDGHSA
jgi:hypothetical protein